MSSFFTTLLRKFRSEGAPRPAKIQKPSLSNFVKTVCVPKWFEKFSDEELGGFHERLDGDFRPLEMGYKRLLTQCRGTFMFMPIMGQSGS